MWSGRLRSHKASVPGEGKQLTQRAVQHFGLVDGQIMGVRVGDVHRVAWAPAWGVVIDRPLTDRPSSWARISRLRLGAYSALSARWCQDASACASCAAWVRRRRSPLAVIAALTSFLASVFW